MPVVHAVKKARIDMPQYGIRRGDSYYWWKFRGYQRICSKSPPRPSMLTRSEFLKRYYTEQERIADTLTALQAERLTFTEALEVVRRASDTVYELRGICEARHATMADYFPNGCAAMSRLKTRITKCDEILEKLGEALEVEDYSYGAEELSILLTTVLSGIDWTVE